MLNKGIIRPSASSWATPAVLIPKKDGSVCFWVDYRSLNAKTTLDEFLMPQIQDILESMYGASVFSTLDLRSGYWQVMMDDCSIQKTAFITKNTSIWVNSSSLRVEKCGGYQDWWTEYWKIWLVNIALCIVYCICVFYLFVYCIDDIVVYSKDIQQHLKNLKAVFFELEVGGLTLSLKKCNICKKSLSFLGHVISEEGIKTEETKVEAVSG